MDESSNTELISAFFDDKELVRSLYQQCSDRCCQYFPIKLLQIRAILNQSRHEQSDTSSELIKAIILNDQNNIELLINDKANLDKPSTDFFGTTALTEAVRFGRKDLVEIMISLGANINVRDANEATPLIIAATYGYMEIVELLVSQRAGVNFHNTYERSALLNAIVYGL